MSSREAWGPGGLQFGEPLPPGTVVVAGSGRGLVGAGHRGCAPSFVLATQKVGPASPQPGR